jgi:hypothetical protein
LLAAINATNQQNNVEWVSPASFPIEVADWWKGQKQVLSSEITVTGIQDILSVLQNCKKQISQPATIDDGVSLQYILKQIMKIQQTILVRDKLLKPERLNLLCHSRFGSQPLRVKCS